MFVPSEKYFSISWYCISDCGQGNSSDKHFLTLANAAVFCSSLSLVPASIANL